MKSIGEGSPPPPATESALDNTPCYKVTPLTHPSQVKTFLTNELQDYINDKKKNLVQIYNICHCRKSQGAHIHHGWTVGHRDQGRGREPGSISAVLKQTQSSAASLGMPLPEVGGDGPELGVPRPEKEGLWVAALTMLWNKYIIIQFK